MILLVQRNIVELGMKDLLLMSIQQATTCMIIMVAMVAGMRVWILLLENKNYGGMKVMKIKLIKGLFVLMLVGIPFGCKAGVGDEPLVASYIEKLQVELGKL